LDQVSGAQEETLDWLPPPSEFYAQRFLDFPTTDAQTIQVIVAGLVAQLCGELRARQRGGLQWRCSLDSPDADPLQWEINLFQPGAATRQVMPLIQMHLDQCGMGVSLRAASRGRQDFDREFAVHHIRVAAPLTALLVDRQQLLFDQEPRRDRQQLVHLIDRLSARLGAERVLGAELRAEAQPELACRLQPLIGSRPGAEVSSRAVSAGPLRRPLRLHAPLAVRVFSRDEAGCPARIGAGRDRLRVAAGWGPERIETGWWRGPMIRRDYWRVVLEDGRWLWLFHDLSSDHWFCQGAF
jgi:protein ImuB